MALDSTQDDAINRFSETLLLLRVRSHKLFELGLIDLKSRTKAQKELNVFVDTIDDGINSKKVFFVEVGDG